MDDATPRFSPNPEVVKSLTKAAVTACHGFLEADRVAHEARPDAPTTIFHLTTDMASVTKIARGSELWASQTSSMNDLTEVTYGRSLIVDALAEKQDRTDYQNHLSMFMRNPSVIRSYDYWLRCFVASFCGSIAKSGVWLNYGGRGTGAALGYRRDDLKNTPNATLIRIDYDLPSQLSRMRGLIEVGERVLNETGHSGEEFYCSLVAHVVQLWSSALAVRMKHPAFIEEDEWRLVYYEGMNGRIAVQPRVLTPKVRYRASGESVPYVDLALPKGSLERIVVGSSCLARDVHIFEDLGPAFADLPIDPSTVPVRPTT